MSRLDLRHQLAVVIALLVARGTKLRNGWLRDRERAARKRRQRSKPDAQTSDGRAQNQWVKKGATDLAAFTSGRATLATFIILRARQAAMQVQNASRKQRP